MRWTWVIHTPLLKFIAELETQQPDRQIAVLIAEIVKRHWWEHPLHMHRAWRLRTSLLEYGGSRLVVISVPWYLEEPRIEEALAEEQPVTRHARRAPARPAA